MPFYLHDRPKSFTRHIIERIESSLEINESLISRVGGGKYEVSNVGKTYTLDFGNDENLPYCECEDWQRHKLPCKHFCALLVGGYEVWNSFSSRYQHSPYFNLDPVIIKTLPNYGNEHNMLGTTMNLVCKENTSVCSAVVVQPTFTSKPVLCHDLLSHIKTLLYVVNDPETLHSAKAKLADVVELLEQKAPRDSGLIAYNEKATHSSQPMKFTPLKKKKMCLSNPPLLLAEEKALDSIHIMFENELPGDLLYNDE